MTYFHNQSKINTLLLTFRIIPSSELTKLVKSHGKDRFSVPKREKLGTDYLKVYQLRGQNVKIHVGLRKPGQNQCSGSDFTRAKLGLTSPPVEGAIQ